MKLPKANLVRTYELTYLIPGTATSDEVEIVVAAVEKLLKKHKLSVESQEDWGKKDMAYPIAHNGKRVMEAYYYHVIITAEPSVVQSFEKELFLEQSVMRHLLVVADEQPAEAAPASEKKPAASSKKTASEKTDNKEQKEEKEQKKSPKKTTKKAATQKQTKAEETDESEDEK